MIEEKSVLKALLPVQDVKSMKHMEEDKDVSAIIDVMCDLHCDALGGPRLQPLHLHVAVVRLDSIAAKLARRASSRRATDFRLWIQSHLDRGMGALHKFSNRANQAGGSSRRGLHPRGRHIHGRRVDDHES